MTDVARTLTEREFANDKDAHAILAEIAASDPLMHLVAALSPRLVIRLRACANERHDIECRALDPTTRRPPGW